MSGRLSKYSDYKDSGVDWIGRVPGHWQVLPARVAVSNLTNKNEDAANQNYLSLVAGKGIIPYEDKGDMGNKKPDDLSKCKLVRKGNIVINSMNFFIGAYGMSDYDGVCSPVYIVLDVNQSAIDRRFALRIFGDAGFQVYLSTFGDGILIHRAAIGWDDIKGTYLPIPPLEEQTQIAKFLDYETVKIDALIAKQQQLIALLQEKRQAVISHAVTKGLNPAAPLRDSGVEWLGQVPAHWTVSQLKHNTSHMQTGPFGSQLHAEDYIQGGIPLVNPIHIVNGRIIPESNCTVDSRTYERLARHKLRTGDIIFARRGELGRCAVVREEQDGWLCGSGSLRATLLDRLSPDYAFVLISSSGVRSELALESRGSTMDNLNTDTLGRVRLPVPPLDEQIAILRHIEQVSGQFDKLEKLAVSQSDLLQERRTALIAAAVTGKIDVRGWQPPVATPAAGFDEPLCPGSGPPRARRLDRRQQV